MVTRKYWYRTTYWSCPMCMRDIETERRRVYDQSEAGVYWREVFDYCDIY